MLEAVWGSIETMGEDLTESEWKRHTELPGWTVQDNLVHLSAVEAMSLGRPWRDHEATDLTNVRNEIGKSNEHAVDSRRRWTGAEALAEFHGVGRRFQRCGDLTIPRSGSLNGAGGGRIEGIKTAMTP